MLFTPPTLMLDADHPMVTPVAAAQASELGTFSMNAIRKLLGTALVEPAYPVVCSAPGWLSEQTPDIFQAGRVTNLGTDRQSPFNKVARAASGWLSARASQLFPRKCEQNLGTGLLNALQVPVVRSAPGWLSEQRPEMTLAGRVTNLGTDRQSPFNRVVRAASGWLSARASQLFPRKCEQNLGTGLLNALQVPVVRSAPGWLSEQRPEMTLAGRVTNLGTDRQSPFNRVARAASGWLSARAPHSFHAQDLASDEASGELPHYHLSVFPAEVAEWMAAGPGKLIIDGTLGGGGHSEAFLNAGADVLGIDRDPEALAHASRRLADHSARFRTWEGNFADLEETPEVQGGKQADGLLLDLGVSSRQLDAADRGFSFMRNGPLDMRMGPSSPRTAAEVVNSWSESELSKLMFEYGEEPKARRIAKAIVERRAQRPFDTTLDLADCIEKAIGRHGRTHPATRTFQAVRMAVNEELESLSKALEASARVLKPGGRLLVITFHSLEDRMVKRFLKYRSTAWLDEPGWPDPRPNPDYQFRLLVRKAVAPTAAETSLNPRARSAKLRVAELLAPA